MATYFEQEFQRVLRRTFQVDDIVAKLINDWSCDLSKRKIKIYEDEDGVETTDIDVAPLLVSLKNNGAVINLPTYKNARPKSVTEGEYLVSTANRHGKVLGLTSNQKVFSFSVLTYDKNVVRDGQVGAFRNFMLCGVDGTLRDGWEEIEIFSPQDEGLPERIKLTYMIHPNRWVSFYGKSYLLAKACIARLVDENKYLRKLRVDLRRRLKKTPKKWERSEQVGASETITVTAFEAVVDGLDFQGEYQEPWGTRDTLEQRLERVEQRIKLLDGQLRTLRFLTRITEMAFLDNAVRPNFDSDYAVQDWLSGKLGSNLAKWAVENKKVKERRTTVNMERFARLAEENDALPMKGVRKDSFVPNVQPRIPGWAKDSPWECDYKPTKRARTRWARRRIMPGVFLRWRIWDCSQKVAVDNDKEKEEATPKYDLL